MTTIIVKSRGLVDRRWLSVLCALLVGTCVGGLVGASNGSAVATFRFKDRFVPLEEYDRVCEENAKIARLYVAERQQNVRLTGKHEVARKLFPHLSANPTKLRRP